jgi:hypothetical protein
MARQVEKDVADPKKKLEDAEQKVKDAAADLQVVIEGKFLALLRVGSICFARSRS